MRPTLNCTGYRRRDNGDITARVVVSDPEGNPVYADRINLTSASARKRFAKAVFSRLGPNSEVTAEGIEHTLLEALRDAEKKLAEDPNPTAPGTEPGRERADDYLKTDYGFYRIYTRETVDGVKEYEIRLSNFTARILREIVLDDGVSERRFYEIEGEGEGERLPTVRVEASEFARLDWVARLWGARCRILPGPRTRECVADAVQAFSTDAPVERIFTHTGWRKIGERWVYLHAGGGITGEGLQTDVLVELPDALGAYCLPTPPTGDEQAEAVRTAWQFWKAAQPRVSAAFLGAAYLAPLAEWIRPDFSLWAIGPTGRLKTSYASCVAAHFGHFGTQHVPASWEATSNALEMMASAIKDALFLIDDFRPPADRVEAAEMRRKAARLIRSAGNLSGRARLTSTLNLRRSYFPRGVIVSTAEDLPGGESATARCWVVRFEGGSVDPDRLAFFQERTDSLRAANAAYIGWLAARLDRQGAEWITSAVRKARETLRGAGVHLRQARMLACLSVAWAVFTEFCMTIGVISEQEALRRAEEVRAALIGTAAEQSEHLVEERPEVIFVTTLLELFATGDAYLEDPDGGPPHDARTFGWEDPAAERTRPGAVRLGWLRQDYIDLIPTAALSAIRRRCRETGMSFHWSARAVHEALARGGFLLRGSDRLTVTARTASGVHRVLRLDRAAVEALRGGCNRFVAESRAMGEETGYN